MNIQQVAHGNSCQRYKLSRVANQFDTVGGLCPYFCMSDNNIGG